MGGKFLNHLFKGLFSSPDRTVEHRIEQIDQRNREVRHDLKNIQSRADYVKMLVEQMREDPTWKEGNRRRDPG